MEPCLQPPMLWVTDKTLASAINSVVQTEKDIVKTRQALGDQMAKLNKSFQEILEVNISEVVNSTVAIIYHDFQIGSKCHGTTKLNIGIRHLAEAQIMETLGEMAIDPDSTCSMSKLRSTWSCSERMLLSSASSKGI